MSAQLRPVVEADLVHLTGDDSRYENYGPRAPRTSVYDPSLTAHPGGLAVVDDDGSLLGIVSWVWQRWGRNEQSRNPMIGIWLDPAARGRGVGTEAQRQIVDLFFLHTTVNRVEAHTDVENVAEQRALEKAGFRQEGVTRGAQWRDGAYHDGYLYSIVRSDWTRD